MSRPADVKFVILFEDELRIAAKALAYAQAEAKKAREGNEEMDGSALTTAFEACWAALYHLTLDDADGAQVTLGAKCMFEGTTRLRKKK